MLQDVTGCYGMLQDVAGCYRMLQDAAGCLPVATAAAARQGPQGLPLPPWTCPKQKPALGSVPHGAGSGGPGPGSAKPH